MPWLELLLNISIRIQIHQLTLIQPGLSWVTTLLFSILSPVQLKITIEMGLVDWCLLMLTLFLTFKRFSSPQKKKRRRRKGFWSSKTHGESMNGRVFHALFRSLEWLLWCLEWITSKAASLWKSWWRHILDKHWRLCWTFRSDMCLQIQQKLHHNFTTHNFQ